MQYGFLSVIPPLVTIILALVWKNVFVALLVGIFLANMILAGGALFAGLNGTFYSIVKVFASNSNTIVLLSIFLIGAVLYLIERSGGVEAFIDIMVKKRGIIKSKKAAEFFTWLLGCIVFTSGSLSCMVTGSVARPLNDSMKVSHEKASFLVHSTSTPVCVLLPLSGWLGAMSGYLASGGVPKDQSITVLFQSIPLNFYCVIAVLFALLSCFLPLDFGPMKKAEERVDATGALDDPNSTVNDANLTVEVAQNAKASIWNMVLPMLVMIVGILTVLFITGKGNPTKGAGMQALLWGCMFSAGCICLMCLVEKVFTLEKLTSEFIKGMGSMLSIVVVLTLAFAMGPLVKQLDTGHYLSHIFMNFLSPALLPVLTFIIAMILSFATGTSMGTMAIMGLIAIPMALQMGVNIPLTAGAMFGGAIFGDHSSPISDTTIMSCATTGCNIMDHVKTQMPYTLCCAAVSIVLYIVMGFIM